MQESTNKINNNHSQAYQYLIRILSKQNYSTFKLISKLKIKNFNDIIVREAINKVIKQGYHNESMYIELKISQLMKKCYSRNYINLKLETENIYNQEVFIQKIFEENDVTELSQQKKLLKTKIPEDIDEKEFDERMKIKAKAYQYLFSKGHEPLDYWTDFF